MLDLLAPGDFAAVKRQVDVLGEAFEPDEFLSQLEAEHRVKPGGAAAARHRLPALSAMSAPSVIRRRHAARRAASALSRAPIGR